MNGNNQSKIGWRATLIGLSILSMTGMANADLKLTVSVGGTGTGSQGVPASGTYEVDMRGSLARIVLPSGAVRIFDFDASQTAVLFANTNTYYLESLPDALAAGPGTKLSVSIAEDRTAKSQTKFGTQTQKVTITSQAATAKQGQTKGKQRGSVASTATLPVISAPFVQAYGGTAWLANGSEVKSSIGSISPLLLVGVPKALVSPLAATFDQQGIIPLNFDFMWTDANNVRASLTMAVSAIDSSSLDASLFQVPADYRKVEKPTSSR